MLNLVVGGAAAAGVVIVILNTFQENLMFYVTPTQVGRGTRTGRVCALFGHFDAKFNAPVDQALEKFAMDPTKNRLRLGGLVLEGR